MKIKDYFWWWVIGSGLVWGCIYWLSSPKVPVNYADSNDMLLAAVSGGLAHPPGYPLFTVPFHWLIQLFSGIEPFLVMKAGVILLTIMTFGLVAGVTREWLLGLGERKKRRVELIGMASVLVATLWVRLSMTWLNGVTFEVFSLGTLLALAGGLVLYRIKGKPLPWFYMLFGFFSGLAFWHHPLSGLITVGLVICWPQASSLLKYWRPLFWGVGLSLLSYGFMFWIASGGQGYTWYQGSGPFDAISFWWRVPYEAGGSQIETYSGNFNLVFLVTSTGRLMQMLLMDMGLGVAGIVVVFWWLARKDWQSRLMMGWALVGAAGLLVYMKFPPDSGVMESEFFWGSLLRYRMYFGVLVVALIGVSAGVWRSLALMESRLGKAGVRGAGLALLAGLIVSAVWPDWRVEVSESNFPRALALRVLEDMPANGTLLVDTDMALAVMEARQLGQRRSDVRVLPLRFWVEPQLRNEFMPAPLRDDERFRMVWPIVRALEAGERVILLAPEASLLAFLGEEGNPFFVYPYGYGLEISKKAVIDVPQAFDFGMSETFEVLGEGLESWWGRGEQGWLSVVHTQLGYYATRLGMESGEYHFATAKRLAEFDFTRRNIETTQAQANEIYQELGSYAGYEVRPVSEYLTLARDALDIGDQEPADYWVTRALLLEPTNEAALILYGKIGTGGLK